MIVYGSTPFAAQAAGRKVRVAPLPVKAKMSAHEIGAVPIRTISCHTVQSFDEIPRSLANVVGHGSGSITTA
jgi:hypothetical protein